MNKKMTAAEVQDLIDNNIIETDTSAQEYVDLQVPNWIIEVLQLLFPSWSPEKSLEFICQQFIAKNKPTKLN